MATGANKSTTSDRPETPEDVREEAAAIVRARRNEDNPASAAITDMKAGHMLRKAFDVTGKAMGWIGGAWAIGSAAVMYKNRNRNNGQQQGGGNR